MPKLLHVALGAILAFEFPAAVAAAPGLDDLMSRADINHDGIVTRAEFRLAREQMFDRLDRGHRGYLTLDQARLPQAREALANLIRVGDVDHDGRLTRAELALAPMPAFDAADSNHDGVVDRNELRALAAARRP